MATAPDKMTNGAVHRDAGGCMSDLRPLRIVEEGRTLAILLPQAERDEVDARAAPRRGRALDRSRDEAAQENGRSVLAKTSGPDRSKQSSCVELAAATATTTTAAATRFGLGTGADDGGDGRNGGQQHQTTTQKRTTILVHSKLPSNGADETPDRRNSLRTAWLSPDRCRLSILDKSPGRVRACAERQGVRFQRLRVRAGYPNSGPAEAY